MPLEEIRRDLVAQQCAEVNEQRNRTESKNREMLDSFRLAAGLVQMSDFVLDRFTRCAERRSAVYVQLCKIDDRSGP